jgi:polyisoprenoid-binding protein YceI
VSGRVKFKVTSGKLSVQARSRVHDTTTVWSKVSGDVDADPDTLATAGAKGAFTVDMTVFDAGDWLKNRKLRRDFDLDHHPTATFSLDKVERVEREGDAFTANATGTLRWRGKEVVLTLAGRGILDRVRLEATATFTLDIRALGLSAPRFFVFKMEDEVTVEVTLAGTPA